MGFKLKSESTKDDDAPLSNDKMSDHVYLFENSLPQNFCSHLIKRFQIDERKYDGVTGGGLNKEIKDSLDLNIIPFEDWKEEKEFLDECLFYALDQIPVPAYMTPNFTGNKTPHDQQYSYDCYQIQEYLPKTVGYKWHHDAMINDLGSRVITYLWYLNTINDNSGHTQFGWGELIEPKEGSLLLFPSTPLFVHRGTPTKTHKKYICTGWLYI
jgi:hypothetical protein